MSQEEIFIFGASHVGIRLARRLATQGQKIIVVDRFEAAPEIPTGWDYVCGDFDDLPNLDHARLAFIVTDEDKLNIRTALAIRSSRPELKIVITLEQSRLGKKLSRHLGNFAFISPPELAATKFVAAIYAPVIPPMANIQPFIPEPEIEIRKSWHVDPLVFRALLAFTLLAFSTTIYFHFAESLPWIDAWYFVVTLMTTVGFGDISLSKSSILSKIIGTILMIASVTNTAVIFALITDSLLRQRLALSFVRRRIKQSDHVIVVGIGAVGLQVVEDLRERGEKVTVVEDDTHGRYMPMIYAQRIPTIIGDAKLEKTLRDAGLADAKALISVTSDDLTNLEIGLNAKSLNPEARVVLRIYDQLLAQSLDQRLDIHFAYSTSSIAAEELAKFAG